MSSTSGDRAPPAPPALAGKSAPTATTSVPKAPPQRPADASKMTTKMECSDRGYPPNSPGEFDSQSAGTPSSKEEEEKGDYAREIAILRGQFVDLQSSVLGRLDDADSLKDKFERLHQAYRTASTDTGERLTGMEYDIKKSKTERASESTLLKQVQRENEEMRQQLANQKAKMDEAARRHAEELSSGLKQLKDELLSSMKEQIDGQNLKRKQLKAYWETELTMRCGSVKESNHWTADLDSIKVLVQKETQGLMELKGNAEAQITEMKSRLCEFSTESQELNDALEKKLEKQLDDERKKRRSDMKELATKKEVAELRESLQAEVQDERTRVEQLRDEFEVILDRVNKVDNLEEEQLRREENFTSSVRSWQTERERIQAEELKTMKAQIKEDTEAMRQELLNTKTSVEDTTAAMMKSVEDTNHAMKESLDELKEEAFQEVQDRLDEVKKGVQKKEEELDMRGARLEKALEDLSWKCNDLDAIRKQQWMQTKELVDDVKASMTKELQELESRMEMEAEKHRGRDRDRYQAMMMELRWRIEKSYRHFETLAEELSTFKESISADIEQLEASNGSGPQQTQPQDPVLDVEMQLKLELREQQEELNTFHMRLQELAAELADTKEIIRNNQASRLPRNEETQSNSSTGDDDVDDGDDGEGGGRGGGEEGANAPKQQESQRQDTFTATAAAPLPPETAAPVPPEPAPPRAEVAGARPPTAAVKTAVASAATATARPTTAAAAAKSSSPSSGSRRSSTSQAFPEAAAGQPKAFGPAAVSP